MLRRSEYDADPATENTPFTVEELSARLSSAPSKLRGDEVVHLLRRALATASTLRRVRLEFDNELRRRSSMMPSTGGATVSANPEAAARFLSPEQLTQYFDKFAQEKLASLESARLRTESLQAELVLFVTDPSLDPALAARLRDLIERNRR